MNGLGPIDGDEVARELVLNADSAEAELARQQVEFLRKQLELQNAQLGNLALQRDKLGEEVLNLRARNFSTRLWIALQIVFAVGIALLIGLLVAAMVSAWKSPAVIIDEFQLPPKLAEQGLTGEVVAGQLLDALRNLQDQTQSLRGNRSLGKAWSSPIKLDLRERHGPIDLRRYLYAWFGHETRLDGNLVAHGDDWVLTVRGNDIAGRTFGGTTDTLAALITKAAEYVYGESDPYAFGSYLLDAGRDEEAIAFAKAEMPRLPSADQPLLLNIWGNALVDKSDFAGGLEKYRAALRLDPQFWTAYTNLSFALMNLGDEEGGYRAGVALEQATHRGSWLWSKTDDEGLFQNLDSLRRDLSAQHAAQMEELDASKGTGADGRELAPLDAETLVRMHDWRGAEMELQTTTAADKGSFVDAQIHYVRGLMALQQKESAKAVAEYRAMEADIAASPDIEGGINFPRCYLGLAEGLAGNREASDAALIKGGHYVDCYRFKADLADHNGDWPQAQDGYAAAVAIAPSLPTAYYSWGEALRRRGDLAAAAEKYQAAHERGPHWADPLERWGEVLAAQNDDMHAVKHYREAAAYAPHWGALYLHWGQSLDQLGRHDEAVAQYRKALDLDLSAADRASLASCCR